MGDWILFATAETLNEESLAFIKQQPTNYSELKRKGLDSATNHMRLVEHIGDTNYVTMALWPKDKKPNNQLGPTNCYDTYLTSTRAKIPFAALRGDPVPRIGDRGFIYLVPDYPHDKNVYKYGTVKVNEIIYRAESPTHLMYTLIVEKTETESVTPPTPKPNSTPKRKASVRDQGTSSGTKKKKKKKTKLPPGQLLLNFL